MLYHKPRRACGLASTLLETAVSTRTSIVLTMQSSIRLSTGRLLELHTGWLHALSGFRTTLLLDRTTRHYLVTVSGYPLSDSSYSPLIPRSAPRASGCQYGARSPEKAGTKTTPPLEETVDANSSTSLAEEMMPKLSRSHDTARPATAMAPVTGRGHDIYWSPLL